MVAAGCSFAIPSLESSFLTTASSEAHEPSTAIPVITMTVITLFIEFFLFKLIAPDVNAAAF
jgi:hypothetical protein